MSSRNDYNVETCFPWKLMEDVIAVLKRKKAYFGIYRDYLPKSGGVPRGSFDLLEEYGRWRCGLSGLVAASLGGMLYATFRKLPFSVSRKILSCFGSMRPGIHVILQHDADRQLYKTLDAMWLEKKLGVVSSAYFFHQRNMWDGDREPYLHDIDSMKEFEAAGFEIGYHLNAYELADYDAVKAHTTLQEDIGWFNKHFNLTSYVPHGGVRGPRGINNLDMPVSSLLDNLLCGYNGRSFCCDYTWSDGQIGSAAVVDPRVFADSLPKDCRVRFLFHPQYFGNQLSPVWLDKPIARQEWWRQLWRLD